MQDIHAHKIIILDFGSQYTQLIARRIRELGVYCELYPFNLDIEQLKSLKPHGIILSGGPESVIEDHSPRVSEKLYTLGIPILGICYGMQLMATQLGGSVESGKKKELGFANMQLKHPDALFSGIMDSYENDCAVLHVWMSHGDHVETLPPGFSISASTDVLEIAAMADENRQFYGVQFHPEVTHTKQGMRLLERFVKQICGCASDWSTESIIQDSIEKIRTQIGQDQILLALSGGVDSSVVAALLHEAIGDQLTCVFVDTGLLRLGEAEQVLETFVEHFHLHIIHVDAKQRFFTALKGVMDPEKKRKIIGSLFIDIFEEEALKLHGVKWLAQGTIYSDVIESAATGGGSAHVIKSHHNVGGLPATMNFKLVEPLRELFKDEVRKLGLALGLPYSMLYRHPFPGAGLGIRVLEEVKPEYVAILQKADAIFIEELHRADYYEKVSQAFAVFLPVQTVAVMGDARRYEYVIALRAVETIDFMTAIWAHLPYALLEKISLRICNEIAQVSRVVYDITGKPPATIEWE